MNTAEKLVPASLLEEQIKQNQELIKQNKELQLMITKMQQQLDQLLRIVYGQGSEKLNKKNKNNQATDNSQLKSNNNPNSNDNNNKQSKRRQFPEHLITKEVEYKLPESEQQCPICLEKYKKIGELITRQLEFIPAKLYVKKIIRFKYGCHLGCSAKTADMPTQPIHKGMAGPGLLAEILIAKYQDSIPLYRQALRFKRHQISIPESTLGDWVMQCSGLLEPLVNLMHKDLLGCIKIHTDDTPVPVLAKGKTKLARLWPYVADARTGHKITVYDFSKTRVKSAPLNFLEGYKGYLQADAYAGYDCLYESKKIIEIGCLAHARRKFVEIDKALKGKDSLAKQALELIGNIYYQEKLCRNFDNNKRYYYRKKYVKPLYKIFYNWLKYNNSRTIPKMPIHLAIGYSLNHWRALQNVLAHGCLEVDNNIAERAVKPLVIGRKNYLFAGSYEGGKRAAIIYSIIETCRQNNINTFEYLSDVLSRIQDFKVTQLRKLLPYNWKPELLEN